jgi:hypothetical protein
VPLRLAYLGVPNAFALLRLLPMSDRDKDVEILALRHQITVLERQLGTTRPRFLPSDRVFLAALLRRLPRDVLRRFRLLVQPDTVLRSAPGSPGAPPRGQIQPRPSGPAADRPLHPLRPPAGAAPGTGESLLWSLSKNGQVVVPIVPRKSAVLPQVALHSPKCRVARTCQVDRFLRLWRGCG